MCFFYLFVDWKTVEPYSGRYNFVFDALLYLKPVERFENLVRIRRPGSCNNGTSKRILNMLETS